MLTKYLNLFEAEGWGVEADGVKILLVSLQKLSLGTCQKLAGGEGGGSQLFEPQKREGS